MAILVLCLSGNNYLVMFVLLDKLLDCSFFVGLLNNVLLVLLVT